MMETIGWTLVGFFFALDIVMFVKLVKVIYLMVKDHTSEECEDDE